VFANKRLVHGVVPDPVMAGEFPRYLYRGKPDSPGDSGWRIFTGSETQADTDDSSNFQVNAVETLLTVHPQLAQVLKKGVNGAWEWSETEGRYLEVQD
jgi:hypothetical protein